MGTKPPTVELRWFAGGREGWGGRGGRGGREGGGVQVRLGLFSLMRSPSYTHTHNLCPFFPPLSLPLALSVFVSVPTCRSLGLSAVLFLLPSHSLSPCASLYVSLRLCLLLSLTFPVSVVLVLRFRLFFSSPSRLRLSCCLSLRLCH